MADNEAYRKRLVWAERAHRIDVVALGRQAGLSRQDFIDSLYEFYGDYELIVTLVDMWDDIEDGVEEYFDGLKDQDSQ